MKLLAHTIAVALLAAGTQAHSQKTSTPDANKGGNVSGNTANISGAGNTNPATPSPNAGTQAKAANLSAGDRKFLEEAAIDGMAEVELGKLARQRGTNDAVKQFGSRMASDHQKAGDELKGLAGAKGVQLPAAPDRKHQKELDKLSKAKDFDHEYMELMVKEHRKDVSEFRKQAKGAKDADVQAFASKTLPTLEAHLKLAQDTQKSVKGRK